ncbi:MAG: hypothetical protein R6W93_03710 [Candidatus Limnocylindrales bacterium]
MTLDQSGIDAVGIIGRGYVGLRWPTVEHSPAASHAAALVAA